MKEININEIIIKNNLPQSHIILLTERPRMGIYTTTLNIINSYKNSYLFDLDGEIKFLHTNKNIDSTFYSSIEIINKIQTLNKDKNINLFIINNWKLINDKND